MKEFSTDFDNTVDVGDTRVGGSRADLIPWCRFLF